MLLNSLICVSARLKSPETGVAIKICWNDRKKFSAEHLNVEIAMKFSNFHFKASTEARLSSEIKKGESVMEFHGNYFKVPSKQQQI